MFELDFRFKSPCYPNGRYMIEIIVWPNMDGLYTRGDLNIHSIRQQCLPRAICMVLMVRISFAAIDSTQTYFIDKFPLDITCVHDVRGKRPICLSTHFPDGHYI